MKSKWNAFLVLIILVSAAFVTVVQTVPPAPLLASAPATEFSGDRTIEHIRIIAARPRLTGSSGYDAARNYVLEELKNLGLETEIQRSDGLQNTIGWIKGNSSSSDIVLLTAHLDSVADNVGASDVGS